MLNNYKMPKLCAWCGLEDVIGNYPVVMDKSRVVRMKFEFLKYEDKIYNFLFPICQLCKSQIKRRRNLDNNAIKIAVVFALILIVFLGFTSKNVGMSIAAGFGIALLLFAIYSILKNLLLNQMKYASETSWGTFDGAQFDFRIDRFGRQFNKLNKITKT